MKKIVYAAAVCSLLMLVSTGCGRTENSSVLLIGESVEQMSSQEEGEAWEAASEEARQSTVTEVCVYVCGAVENPGVVLLPEGSRAADALEAAGGFTGDAAPEAVNLAQKVSDGEKLYFPTQEESRNPAWQEADSTAGLVNINTAGVAELCTLPGIGESRAADIISYREANGLFETCSDIMQVPGIKESVYSKLSDKITVW